MTVHLTDVSDRVAANVDAVPVQSIERQTGIYRDFFKRVFDVILVLMSLPFVVPFVAIVALLVSRDGHNPFFLQERIGKDGRRFTLWKLRTMVPNAEALLEKHLEEDPSARLEWNSKQKLSCDPRCTRFGIALRKSSIDELPQLINVLLGDMSLVGPRPMLPSQQALYPGRGYYKMRPGITGPWQVSERNASGFAERALYDDLYHETVSLGQDFRLLFKTVFSVFRGTGC